MKERFLFLVTALALFSYGCGSPDDGGASRAISNPNAEEAAQTAVNATTALGEVKTAPDSADAMGALSNMYAQLSVMASSGAAGVPGFATAEGSSAKAGFDTCVTASDTLVTYNSCEYGSTSIDGTIGIKWDTITCNLTVNSELSGTAVGFTMVGSLTVTETLVTGSMTYDTNISGIDIPAGAGSLHLEANYNDVGVDAQGCPVSGSLTVRQSVTGGVGYDFGVVRADFGPSCGDVQLYN